MAEERKTFVFEGRDSGIGSMMDKLKRSSEDLGRGLIRDARAFTVSSKESVRYIEDEIKAIERKNQILIDSRRIELDQNRAKGLQGAGSNPVFRNAVESGYSKQVAKLDSESATDKIQIELLREMIDTIKTTARQEIVEDRKNVTDQIRTSETVDALNPQGDEFQVFKETIQKEMLGQSGSDGGVSGGAVLSRGVGVASNPMYAAGALAGMLPFGIGVGAAMGMNMALGAAEGRLSALSSAQAIGGAGRTFGMPNVDNISDLAAGKLSRLHSIGMTEGDMLKTLPAVMRAKGSSGNAGGVAMDMMFAEKGLGLDQGTLGSFLQGAVRGGGASGVSDPLQTVIKGFQTSGLLGSGNDMSKLPELVGMQNSLMAEQILRLDNIDVGINTSVLRELSDAGGAFKNPTVLARVAGALDQGIRSPSNQFAQAIQFGVMGRMNPNASRFELMEMQEQGLQNPAILQGMLAQAQSMSGGNKNIMMENLKAMFPQLSFSQTRTLTEGFLSGETDFSKTIDEITAGTKGVNIEQRAKDVVSVFEKNQSRVNSVLEIFGVNLALSTAAVIEGLANLAEMLGIGVKKNIVPLEEMAETDLSAAAATQSKQFIEQKKAFAEFEAWSKANE